MKPPLDTPMFHSFVIHPNTLMIVESMQSDPEMSLLELLKFQQAPIIPETDQMLRPFDPPRELLGAFRADKIPRSDGKILKVLQRVQTTPHKATDTDELKRLSDILNKDLSSRIEVARSLLASKTKKAIVTSVLSHGLALAL